MGLQWRKHSQQTEVLELDHVCDTMLPQDIAYARHFLTTTPEPIPPRIVDVCVRRTSILGQHRRIGVAMCEERPYL